MADADLQSTIPRSMWVEHYLYNTTVLSDPRKAGCKGPLHLLLDSCNNAMPARSHACAACYVCYALRTTGRAQRWRGEQSAIHQEERMTKAELVTAVHSATQLEGVTKATINALVNTVFGE